MKKNSQQAAHIFREFDGNFVDGCFPSNSDLTLKKQAEHILQEFDGNLVYRCFPSNFCFVRPKQAAPVCENEAGASASLPNRLYTRA